MTYVSNIISFCADEYGHLFRDYCLSSLYRFDVRSEMPTYVFENKKRPKTADRVLSSALISSNINKSFDENLGT